ncbi:DNA/RNA helicase domain-containing protein [Lacticaseibacillus pantheris]
MNTGFSIREFVSSFSDNVITNALKCHTMQSKPKEQQDFFLLGKEIINILPQNQDIFNFYLDTDLKVIPDFDILYFGNETIINIDLKDENGINKLDEILAKFKKQKRLLRLCSTDIINLVYCAKEDKLLREIDGQLYTFAIHDFVELLLDCENRKRLSPEPIVNKVELLTPKDYLISPTKQIEKFIAGEYWLSDKQQKISDRLASPGIVSVNGPAGTGKTLIAFDFIRRFYRKRKILFIFPGYIREGHKMLEKRFVGTDFVAGKDATSVNLDCYDVVLVDEAQRMNDTLRKFVDKWARKNAASKTIGIFFDVKQRLGKKDSGGIVESLANAYTHDGLGELYSLENSLRSNKYITGFVRNVFNLNEKPKSDVTSAKMRSVVQIKYFKNADGAIPWIKNMIDKGYTFLTLTPDNRRISSADQFTGLRESSKNTHEIIGDEADNVVTYLDNSVKYSRNGLIVKDSEEYYYTDHESYVNMSRARDHLALAIINNPDVFRAITEVVLGLEKDNANKH